MENKLLETIKEVTRVGEYRNMQMMDAALGICGETSEVCSEFYAGNKEKLISELGDALWYLHSLADAYNVLDRILPISRVADSITKNDGMSEYSNTDIVVYSLSTACDIADYVKKFVIKGISVEPDVIVSHINYMILIFAYMADRQDLKLIDAVKAAIDKFSVRYPNGVEAGEVR